MLGLRLGVTPIVVILMGCPAQSPPAAPDAAPVAKAPAPDARPASPAKEEAPPGPPFREATREEVEQAIDELVGQVKAGAADPTNPWAMAHGLLAFGPDLQTTTGRPAIDVMVRNFIRTEKVAGRTVYRFPPRKDEIPVEPHPDLIAKSMVEVGVPLTHTFTLKGGKKITLQRIVDDAAWVFTMPKDSKDWHKFAWSLGLFLDVYGESGTLNTHTGPVPMARLIQTGIAKLENEQGFLLAAFRAERPDLVQKQKQDIYAHTCGGLHFVQGGAHAAGSSKDKNAAFRIGKQLELVDFRWDAERRIYRKMIRTQPKYRYLLLVQEMKFHGHVLETMALAHEWGVLDANASTRAQARRVAADLVDAVIELRPMFRAQEKLRQSTPQSYYDLIGDGCHAIRGLRQALVAFYAPQNNP